MICNQSEAGCRCLSYKNLATKRHKKHKIEKSVFVHFVQDATTISADRLVAERQLRCDLFYSLTGCDRAQHFEFSVREIFMRYFSRLRKLNNNLLSQRWTNILTALNNF